MNINNSSTKVSKIAVVHQEADMGAINLKWMEGITQATSLEQVK